MSNQNPPLEGLKDDNAFINLLDNKSILSGTTREVYYTNDGSHFVIKKARRFTAPNITEWLIWHEVLKMEEKDILNFVPRPGFSLKFGRCTAISETGRYLMMERLDDIPQEFSIVDDRFPLWLNDKKPDAFGVDAFGNVKVRDYATIDFFSGLSEEMERVPWMVQR